MRVLEWHGAPGHRFAPGDLIVELETHKAVIEGRAGQAGVLRRRHCEEGDWCALEGVLGVLSDDAAESLTDASEAAPLLQARFALA